MSEPSFDNHRNQIPPQQPQQEEKGPHKNFLTDEQRLLPLANIRKIMHDALVPKRACEDRRSSRASKHNASEQLWQQDDDDDVDESNFGETEKPHTKLNDY